MKEAELSKHPTKGYRISIGYYTTPEGKRSPRVFWLGQARRQAEDLAGLVRFAYQELVQSTGSSDWTAEAIQKTKIGIDRMRASQQQFLRLSIGQVEEAGLRVIEGPKLTPEAKRVITPAEPATGKTLYDAIAAYQESLKGKNTSESHKIAVRYALEGRLKKARPDIAMERIDYAWIDSLCDFFKARPATRSGQKMAAASVTHTMTYLRAFFVWCDDVEYSGWVAPRKLLKPFRVTVAELMTPAELRASATIQQFDLGTLRKLYQAARPRVRAWMLAGLFTGATQAELAVMERAEFDLPNAKLSHIRNKTAVAGEYWLPPELTRYLAKQWKKSPADTLAFRTGDGRPLVSFANGKKVGDAVRQGWARLRKTAEVPDALSFKYLRKFLADWMMRAGGEAMGQIALSHSRTSVLRKHYTTSQDYARFHELQQRMYGELVAAKLFEPFTAEELEQMSQKTAA